MKRPARLPWKSCAGRRGRPGQLNRRRGPCTNARLGCAMVPTGRQLGRRNPERGRRPLAEPAFPLTRKELRMACANIPAGAFIR